MIPNLHDSSLNLIPISWGNFKVINTSFEFPYDIVLLILQEKQVLQFFFSIRNAYFMLIALQDHTIC